jgi:hypothetical protein
MPTITAGTHTNIRGYDPAVPSDGLTLDTDRGPVDLVAVWHVMNGVPVRLTDADEAYVVGLIAASPGMVVTPVARAMRKSNETLKRAVDRRRAADCARKGRP